MALPFTLKHAPLLWALHNKETQKNKCTKTQSGHREEGKRRKVRTFKLMGSDVPSL